MLAATWVISSHRGRRANLKLHARARMNQIRWLLDNIQDQCEHWYYYDLFRQEYVNFVGEIVSEMWYIDCFSIVFLNGIFFVYVGNNCPPGLIAHWVISSHRTAPPHRADRRIRHMLYIFNNVEGPMGDIWGFFNLEAQVNMTFNGKILPPVYM